jgi:proteasome assembly chaperone (PAC2) family protein
LKLPAFWRKKMDGSIRILNRIEAQNPVMVAAWPGMGNVAYGAAMYLKETLKAAKFAEISPDNIFYRTGIQIAEGIVDIPQLPKSEFFFYRNQAGERDLIIFIGEAQPVMEKEFDLARMVVELAVSYKITEIVTFAATPVNITHHAEPGVLGVSTKAEFLHRLPVYGVRIMSAGHIGGLNGLLLGVGKSSGIEGTCFLGEIPFYTAKIENPKSSLAVLKVFSRYVGITVDLGSLLQMAKFVEEEIDRVSKSTKQTLFGEESGKEEGEEKEAKEEESVRSHDVVPSEARDRIEYLFELAEGDISRAGDLKEELDKWGIFQEYEDRFLDLFGGKNL